MVLLGFVVLSATLHITGLTTVSTEAEAGAMVVEMRNNYLAPDRLEIPVVESQEVVYEGEGLEKERPPRHP